MAGDLNREASELWNSLKPIIDKEIDARTQGMVQRRKAKVTTAPSLVTNTIGVTEPFGTEMFLPFNTNIMSASVGDFVWVEYMYGMTNAFASMFASADEKDWYVAGDLFVRGNEAVNGNLSVIGDTTLNGVFDITPRRCYAASLNAGWYRVLVFKSTDAGYRRGATGNEIVFHITRRRTTAGEETHEIKMLCQYDNISFVDEVSKSLSSSNYQRITKIRYTYDGTNGYVDICVANVSTYVTVDFEVYCEPSYQALYTSGGLQSVDPSPSGETVLTEYTFAANTDAVGTVVGASGFTPNEIDVKRSGRVVYARFYVQNVSIAANTNTIIGTLSGVPFPTTNIRWLAGGGAHAYDAVTPVYAILTTSGVIAVTSPSAISAVNITISYIV